MSVSIESGEINFIGGEWRRNDASDIATVFNPATEEILARVPLADAPQVNAAIEAAAQAFPDWRRTPPQERIQYLFQYKRLLEAHADEIATTITSENGKTFAEARAELQRGIENVEVACGIPSLMQGYNLEDVARGIDETMIRQPIGVAAAITPFNFPAMIPLWFLPYAIACGNTFVLKPSERVPLTARRLIDLLDQTGLPKGVVNLVVGGKAAVDALLEHPAVRAISFVGSTPVAQYVYATGSRFGKRVQCQGGAKNFVVVMPDADQEMAAQIVTDSAFGCAGQRCLAISSAILVGDAQKPFTKLILDRAASLRVGNGLSADVQMGPVISPQSRDRIESLIGGGVQEGGRALLDGRQKKPAGPGAFLGPTVLTDVPVKSSLGETEIFGPVLTLHSASGLDDALATLASSAYGNAASIFTTSGVAARRFRYEAQAGNIGVNIGVAAPMAYFPFSGWKNSFFGVLHGQGRDGVEFYTDKKVVVERWPQEWSRKF
jgi:malonate-semialdehyde dehydrogenase (acetylating) / methylmalonate-semialdehyde dehydrogenase